jgi:hypothetical protein
LTIAGLLSMSQFKKTKALNMFIIPASSIKTKEN